MLQTEATAAEMAKLHGSGVKKEELDAFKDRVRHVRSLNHAEYSLNHAECMLPCATHL
jgi:hypothetical protein